MIIRDVGGLDGVQIAIEPRTVTILGDRRVIYVGCVLRHGKRARYHDCDGAGRTLTHDLPYLTAKYDAEGLDSLFASLERLISESELAA